MSLTDKVSFCCSVPYSHPAVWEGAEKSVDTFSQNSRLFLRISRLFFSARYDQFLPPVIHAKKNAPGGCVHQYDSYCRCRLERRGFCAIVRRIGIFTLRKERACPVRNSDRENKMSEQIAPIGIFDSGYGGLTILQEIRRLMPRYDYLYLGDNARSPYGSRSFEIVYKFTLQAVERLFALGSPLVILACNTASAKALRSIQQQDLPQMSDPSRRVLGIIRPTVEAIDGISSNKHIGILATEGTVSSHSYQIEIAKLFPSISVSEEACPMWVPLVENGEADSPGADYYVRKHLDALLRKDRVIDTIVLACTHYPLLRQKIKRLITPSITIVSQGEYVAGSLANYLERHPEMNQRLSVGGRVRYLTTEHPDKFAEKASVFLNEKVVAEQTIID